ncbi:FliH/SctL family protein [Flocculibacter collagenilyticus]|uniref:FliH/SctL family protein n=1 Tax=Flocculibacter collagenilyticus TaxID=2744479 RepID=UPI0018F6C370|nr:hypothetical protein [Flocculibacter collagenilyticus]
MKINRQIDVIGSMQSYIPLSEEKAASNNAHSAEFNEAYSEVPQEIDIKVLLNQLSEIDRKSLLKEIFSVELSQLESNAKNEGFNAGQELAQSTMQSQLSDHLCELDQHIDDWSNMISKFQSNHEWIIKDQKIFNSILFQAVTKLLIKEITDDEYVENLIKSLIRNHAMHDPKKIIISSEQYKQLVRLDKLNDLSSEIQVVADDSIGIGNFRLELDVGSIEHKMDDALNELKVGLLKLAMAD